MSLLHLAGEALHSQPCLGGRLVRPPPRPRSSGDRAVASGAMCVGSNPTEGALSTYEGDPAAFSNALNIGSIAGVIFRGQRT